MAWGVVEISARSEIQPESVNASAHMRTCGGFDGRGTIACAGSAASMLKNSASLIVINMFSLIARSLALPAPDPMSAWVTVSSTLFAISLHTEYCQFVEEAVPEGTRTRHDD